MIEVKFSSKEVCILLPGLEFILCAFLTKQESGESSTSYPFRILPRPPNFDDSTFSSPMMDRFARLFAELSTRSQEGGRIEMDSFELRAAIYAARFGLKLERINIQKAGKRDVKSRRFGDRSANTIGKLKRSTQELIQSLERYLKRADRRFISFYSLDELRTLSREWRSHLRWVQFNLTYLKTFRSLLPSLRKRQTEVIDRLVRMADSSIISEGFELPEQVELRRVIRQFVRYSRRGRLGSEHHLYMLENADSPSAQMSLFEFINQRLDLKE